MTIKQKLTAIIMLPSAAVIISAISAFIAWEQFISRDELADNVLTRAAIVAENCKAALAFSDTNDAEKTLSSFQVAASIEFACVYDKHDQVFATYRRNDLTEIIEPPKLQHEDGFVFENGFLSVFKEVVLDGEKIGVVYVKDDMRYVYSALKRDIAVVAFAIPLMLALLYLVSSRLQRIVSKPISELATGTVRIGNGELAHRVSISSKDELGTLAASFNDMAAKLEESYTNLEEKVDQRTAALASANAQLQEQIAERTEAQRALQRHNKHMECIYSISRVIEQPKTSLEQIFQKTVHWLRNAYQHPDLTCVRITVEGINYQTDNFKKSELSQHAPIKVRGEKPGDIEVYYLAKRSETGEGPFLKEECDLLNAVAEHLGRIAERTKSQENLRLFRNLINQSNDCIFIIEPEWGRFLDANDTACRSLGYTREELITLTAKDIDRSICDDNAWRALTEMLKVEGNTIIEGLYKRQNGTRFPSETSLKHVTEDRQDYIIAVARDISERKKAEQALKESELKFRTIFENAGGAIFIADCETGNILDCNSQAEKLTGRPRSEIIGTHQTQLHPQVEAETYRQKFAAHVEAEHTVDFEGQVQHSDGRLVPVLIAAEHIKIAEKDVLVELFVDITYRKQAEEELKKLKKQIEFILGATKTGLDIIDHDLNIIYIDPEWQTIYGDYKGRKCYEYFMGRDQVCPNCGIIEALKTNKVTVTEEILVKEGNRPVQVTTIPFQNSEGRWLVAEVNVDITERKRAEEKQARLLKEVENVNQELKDFAYIVSHDLKAPLYGIRTVADWILTDYAEKLDPEGKEQLNLLVGRVDRMHRLIDGILAYSKVGRVKEERVSVDLNKLVQNIIDSLAVPEHITISTENKLPVLECEETRIMQVFQNLLSNAVKYMDKPQGKITVSSTQEDGFWKFAVTDNGPGIAEKDFERIFKIFQTASPRDSADSTGVGLTITKKIVEMYGGDIWVESKIGEGSTFFFTLPKQKMEVKNAECETCITC